MAAIPFKAFETFDIVLAKDIVLGRGYGKFLAGTPGKACYRPNGTLILTCHGTNVHPLAQLGVDFTLAHPADQARIWTTPQFRQAGPGFWKPV